MEAKACMFARGLSYEAAAIYRKFRVGATGNLSALMRPTVCDDPNNLLKLPPSLGQNIFELF
jgi:hypothetical protein